MNPSKLVGQVIGNLELVKRIGVGGMGTVFRAEHRALGTPYAVKILHAQFSMDQTTAERFRREAITCSKLRHPNVVFVTDFGLQDELGIYIIMEYLEGASLRQILKVEPRLSVGRMARITEQVCEALEAAHRLGIVHRDLKPDNIMILNEGSQKDFVKVLDFGIAQIKDVEGEEGEKLTRAGLVLGTPAYISPEQINKKAAAVGPGADIYALGIMIYQMITGVVPFSGENEFEILSQHVFKIPEPISAHRSDLKDTLLEKFVLRMLEKNPKDRPESMAQARRELLEAVRELRERGFQDAFYGTEDELENQFEVTSGMFALHTPTPMGITNVIHNLTANSPESRTSSLIMALRGLAAVHEDAFYLALWGVLQRDWLDSPLGSEDFQEANKQIKTIFKLVLGSPNAQAPTETQLKVFRALRDLFALSESERDRQNALVVALQSQTRHPLFPMDILPSWAQAHGSGTWRAFKNIMTTEIRLPFGGVGRPRLTNPDEPAPTAEAPPEQVPVEAPEPARATPAELESAEGEEDKGLGYKLRQDVSISSIKNILSHEISIFGKKKKK